MEQNNLTTWSNTEKFSLRFFLIFFASFCMNNGIIPFVSEYWSNLGHKIGYWFKGVLWGMNNVVEHEMNGSGDTSDDYGAQMFFFLFALLTATIWTLIDRKSRNYDTLYYWLRTAVRYSLALTMISYGFAKVVPDGQFTAPSLNALTRPLGGFTPMGLAWQFFGFSYPYSFFGGAMELIGGILLLFRRTTLLGTLLLITVIANIVMINFSYDVSVKLYSSIYLVMAIFLLAKDGKQLWNFFWADRNIEFTPVFDNKWLRIGKIAVKCLLIGMSVVYPFYTYFFDTEESMTISKPSLYGIYDVEKMEINRKEQPLILNDTTSWKRVVIGEGYGDGEYYGKIYLSFKKALRISCEINDTTRTIQIKSSMDSTQNFVGTYLKRDSSTLVLEGIRQKDTLKFLLKKAPLTPLQTHGIHIISEGPHNY